SCTARGESDFNPLIRAVNRALQDQGVERRFIELPVANDHVNLMFVPPAIFKAAIKKGLIPRKVKYSKEDAFYFNDLAIYHAASEFDDARDGKRAVKEAKQALELDPENFWYMDTMAAAYAEVGNFEDAVRWQRRAMENPDPADAEGRTERLKLYLNHK